VREKGVWNSISCMVVDGIFALKALRQARGSKLKSCAGFGGSDIHEFRRSLLLPSRASSLQNDVVNVPVI
jgi:hypothetical protein